MQNKFHVRRERAERQRTLQNLARKAVLGLIVLTAILTVYAFQQFS
ncbi:hypothetical protein GRI94_15505 [Erythrobacter jejuensis]|uniref:Uncharacterized protein n=1 Tax=Parerythrobacter jejuensis TaxID=795812 RepID=A0A845AMU0_9SPHN|nr:hypothetical protein [Parerythrobacter jejuensis]MXP33233.1 hypothetical protein [Parerythrobacter jejuensis]